RMAAQQLNDQAGTALLQKVNRAVHGRIIPAEDRPSSRNKDVWSLPAAGRGDCEDYALQKRKDLIEAGFPSNRLALSVVIGPH
ncbi:transglutaminase-like cysteine peptidase, partial [Rhizobium ruizarguesonis]